MASLTTFLRLEVHPEGDDIAQGLAARVYDPAWFLARQWQVGEFLGEDGGSAISARWRAHTATIDRFRSGSSANSAVAYDPTSGPLEPLVERAAASTAWTALEAAEAGREFLLRLHEAGLDRYGAAYRSAYPFTAAPAATATVAQARTLRLMAGRVPDGERLAAAFAQAGRHLPAQPAIAAADVATLTTVARAWSAWAKAMVGMRAPPSPAWTDERLAYDFAIAGPVGGGELTLEAANHPGGPIDWFTFDVAAPPAAGATATPSALVATMLPTPLRFRGMPLPRWWTCEDASVDFGQVDGAPADLARLLFLEFALVYGNDFFVIPVRLPIGSLCRTDSLVVTDTFGMRILVPPSAQSPVGGGGFSLFTLNGASAALGDGNLFVLPPVALQPLGGDAVEEVHLLRDEMANLAWAVEHRAVDAAGFVRHRDEDARRLAPRPPSALRTPGAGAPEPLHYRLSSSVPPHWFPLVPVRTAAGVRLKRGTMRADDQSLPQPSGTLLAGTFAIHEEEVPREGAVLAREPHLLRWCDGSTVAWTAWRKRVGRGEGSSGLSFDQVVVGDP